MIGSIIPFNTGENAAEAVRQAHYDLEHTQPVDQLKEGTEWDHKVAEAARDSDSAKSRKS